LFVWSVDDAKDVLFCADNGVDVLITNNPSNARSVLGYH
jgi:glycerophosphoryl diester phosphodiesterase